MHCRDYVKEWGKLENTRSFSNIVMMGQGEPLYNYDNVVKAINLMNSSDGLSISKRRITVSTCGVADKIVQLGLDTGVKLAVSLHAPNNEKRSKIMPINKKFPIEKLMAEIRKYPELSNSRRITFEYIMIDGLNDSREDALELIKLLKGIPSKINLIGFNEWDGSVFKRSKPEVMKEFSNILFKAGYICPIRTPRGNDIMAACGQLKSNS
jgi:23S rRNA (adenine2503-C2)-methyltransferase